MVQDTVTAAIDPDELPLADGLEVLIATLHRRRQELIDHLIAEITGGDDPGAPRQGHIDALAAVEVVLDALAKELQGRG